MSTKKEFAAVATIFAASTIIFEDSSDEEQPKEKKQRAERTTWVKDWLVERKNEGFYWKLNKELETDADLYRNFFRMTKEDFDFILNLIQPSIQKQDTSMRESIPAGERLALTLRFLATGDNFASLQYLFRIPKNTISTIVFEVCDAIYSSLKEEFLKVSVLVYLFL